jgi:hypothetical protein
MNEYGVPVLTKRQTQRAHRYAMDLIRTSGHTRRTCPAPLLAAALCELAYHASTIRWQLQQFITGSAQCAPAKDVARLALQMVMHMHGLSPADQVAYLQTLLGDDETFISNDHTTH